MAKLLLVLGSGLLIGALLLTALAAVRVWRSWQFQAWAEAPAKIHECELETHESAKGNELDMATATYSYRWKGQDYTGSRVSVSNKPDNVGDYQQQLFDQLEAHRQNDTTWICRVNPEDPREAILDPTLRFELFWFVGAGALICWLLGGILTYAAWPTNKHAD